MMPAFWIENVLRDYIDRKTEADTRKQPLLSQPIRRT